MRFLAANADTWPLPPRPAGDRSTATPTGWGRASTSPKGIPLNGPKSQGRRDGQEVPLVREELSPGLRPRHGEPPWTAAAFLRASRSGDTTPTWHSSVRRVAPQPCTPSRGIRGRTLAVLLLRTVRADPSRGCPHLHRARSTPSPLALPPLPRCPPLVGGTGSPPPISPYADAPPPPLPPLRLPLPLPLTETPHATPRATCGTPTSQDGRLPSLPWRRQPVPVCGGDKCGCGLGPLGTPLTARILCADGHRPETQHVDPRMPTPPATAC